MRVLEQRACYQGSLYPAGFTLKSLVLSYLQYEVIWFATCWAQKSCGQHDNSNASSHCVSAPKCAKNAGNDKLGWNWMRFIAMGVSPWGRLGLVCALLLRKFDLAEASC